MQNNKSGRKPKNEESFSFPPDILSVSKKSIFNLVNLQTPVAEGALSLVAQQAD